VTAAIIVGLVGVAALAIAIGRARGAAAGEAIAKKDTATALKDLAAAQQELADTQSFFTAEKARLEAVVSQLKQEVESLAKDLDASPDAVRNRLRGLLGDARRFEEETSPPGLSLPRRTST
jgi:uncharacterized protein (DUF3084 family)